MNVLHIIPSMSLSSGGTSQGIRNIIPELEKLGIRNEVVCLDGEMETAQVNDSFVINALGPTKSPWCYSSKLIPWLINNFNRFDVIIVNALWLYHGYAFNKALKQYKKSLAGKSDSSNYPAFFVMPHGMLDPYFQQAKERKLKAIRNWFYWKLIESKLINNANGLLFTCKTELLLARKSFRPYHPKKEINIGYGAQLPPAFIAAMADAFYEQCPQVKNAPFMLFISRIHEKKGVDLLLKAYKNLVDKTIIHNKQHTDKLLVQKLVIAGPGLETAYGVQMQQLIMDNELQDTVYFSGMLAGDAKWGAFYQSEAFILPSHQENFGIAVVEALACGKPVLISNQVNIWSEIKEAGAGFVEKDTIEGTENLLKSWQLLSTENKNNMSNKAVQCFKNNFSIEIAAKKFKDLVIG